jgi:hypothetical protein
LWEGRAIQRQSNWFIWSISFIWFVSFSEPDKPKKPNKPDEPTEPDPRHALRNIDLQDLPPFSDTLLILTLLVLPQVALADCETVTVRQLDNTALGCKLCEGVVVHCY